MILRTQSQKGYLKTRARPSDYALPAVSHMLRGCDVERLRNGATLVLDPEPALLTPDQMAAAHADLMRVVHGRGGVVQSTNPCNQGSYHGMLPIDPAEGERIGLAEPTRQLIRGLAGLPAIIEQCGWPRKLALPAMVQLGYYPGGSGAKYEPHLDRWPSETHNRRELTVLVYANVGWDADLMGGQLRLHPNGGSVDSTCSAFGFRSDSCACAVMQDTPETQCAVDVPPLPGRVVIFQSGKQMHEVCKSSPGHHRLAITLWVEYE